MGIRLPLRRARRGRHRASCPRCGHQLDRHGGDLRPGPLGADRRPRDRGPAGGGFPRFKGPADPPSAGDRRQAGGRERAATGVAQMDLYQLHWPNPIVPLTEQMAAMRALQRRGEIRHIGVSNFSLARWRAAEGALGGPVLSNQVRFNLVDRRPLRAMTQWAAANDRLVIAYSPLAQGLLSARYDAEHRPRRCGRGRPPSCPRTSTAPGPCWTRCGRSPAATTRRRLRWRSPG